MGQPKVTRNSSTRRMVVGQLLANRDSEEPAAASFVQHVRKEKKPIPKEEEEVNNFHATTSFFVSECIRASVRPPRGQRVPLAVLIANFSRPLDQSSCKLFNGTSIRGRTLPLRVYDRRREFLAKSRAFSENHFLKVIQRDFLLFDGFTRVGVRSYIESVKTRLYQKDACCKSRLLNET